MSKDLEARLNAWRETPFEGDPMVDALLADIPEAADTLRRYREACEAYCKAFDEGTGTVYVEPIIRQALQSEKE